MRADHRHRHYERRYNGTQCQGVTRSGKRCQITEDLDALGYCKYHKPRAARCKALTPSTGQRCKVRWDLDALGYCKNHSPLKFQCRGRIGGSGRRCTMKLDMSDENYLCQYHKHQVVKCHGKFASGAPCKSKSRVNRHGYCPAHPLSDEDLARDLDVLSLG